MPHHLKFVKNNFLPGREFRDMEDFRNQFNSWVEHANTRVHGTTKRVPNEVFLLEERATLQKLPENQFQAFSLATRLVPSNGHIHFKENYYSVPSYLVGKEVTLRFSGALFRVMIGNEEVAVHSIISGRGQFMTLRSHMPDWKSYSENEFQKQNEKKMVDIGEYAHTFFIEILLTQDRYWFQTIRRIFALKEEFGAEAVNLSLKRALAFKVVHAGIIRNILEQKLYLLDLPPKLSLESSDADPPLARDPAYYSNNQIV